MDKMTLDVQSREEGTKAKKLLASGLIPIEFYGKGTENMSLQVDYQAFRKLFRFAGTNTIISLNIDGGKSKVDTIVHDVNYHPITDKIIHVDFVKVKMDEFVYTKIPIVLTGVAPAVKELGGTLMHNLDELEVKCLPGDLIHNIEVSIEPIVDFNSFIRVKDLSVPDTLEVLGDPEEVVVTAVPPRVEEEPEVVEEVAEGEAEGAEAAEGEAGEGEKKEAKAEGGGE